MLRGIGAPELIIILVIVVVVFGVGRLGEVGGALGKGIREFRKATSDLNDEEPKKDEAKKVEADSKS
jgi:sec-independent protein translocase protein TatA